MRFAIDCPAKVNLTLAVGPKEPGGYHPLRTEFQAVSLFDTLTVEEADVETVTCNWPCLPDHNTLTKALRLLGELVQVPTLAIHIEKRVPLESGLGGGSSDAAGLLKVLSQGFRLPVVERDLHEVGFAVGADVPFFLLGGRARAEGYGERLTPLPDVPPRWMVVARPQVNCSTPAMYRALDRLRTEWSGWPPEGTRVNDFEQVAPTDCRKLILRLIGLGASFSMLCGSGSAVYGEFAQRDEAENARAEILAAEPCAAWAVRTLKRSECGVVRALDR